MNRCSRMLLWALAAAAAAVVLPRGAGAQLNKLPADASLDVVRITDRLIILEKTPFRMFALNTPGGIVFFDTEPTADLTRTAVAMARKEFKRKVIAFVVNTHEHHIVGNRIFSGVPIVGSEGVEVGLRENAGALPLYLGPGGQTVADARTERDRLPPGPARDSANRKIAYGEAVIAEAHAPHIPPGVTFNDRMTLRVGDRTIALVAMPRRHSRGDVFIYLPEEHVLLTGGIVGPRPTIPYILPSASLTDMRRWVGVLTELSDSALRIARVIQGHGAELKVADLVFERDYYQRLLDGCVDARARGLTAEQARRDLALDARFRDLLGDTGVAQPARKVHEDNIDAVWKLASGQPALPVTEKAAPAR